MTLHGYRMSVLHDEKVLDIHCTTILILTLLNCTLKNDKDDTVYVMYFLLSLF